MEFGFSVFTQVLFILVLTGALNHVRAVLETPNTRIQFNACQKKPLEMLQSVIGFNWKKQ